MEGSLENVSLPGILRLISLYRQTGAFELLSRKDILKLYFKDGRIAGISPLSKDNQDEIIVRWLLKKEGTFKFTEDIEPPKGSAVLDINLERLILESCRRTKAENVKEFLPAGNAVLQLSPAMPHKDMDIFLKSWEWNFLILFTGEENIDKTVEKSEMEHEEALPLLYGFLSAGLLRKMRFKLPTLYLIAVEILGTMGTAVVDREIRKMGLSKYQMGMKELLSLLSGVENAFSILIGPTRAKEFAERMWVEVKR